MRFINLTYVLLAAISLVQTVLGAGSYTVDACDRLGDKIIHVWDSDGGSSWQSWDGKSSGIIYIGSATLESLHSSVYSKVTFAVNVAKQTATITYRGQTLKFKRPNSKISWDG
ncbi:MAG: hypothetical protein J3R72DRAFT_499305 [Linnemannia gamsii]|nr:MAG: hypothetical protein J3R72DRAFT_499305 [Linnemannia gamsii]